MKELKDYIIQNSPPLFKCQNNNSLEIIFDSKGFFFSKNSNEVYENVKDQPHLYVAWTKNPKGYYYIGKSYQKGGRWKRQHAYHLGSLAYQLLGTINKYDQNHSHWISNWMNEKTITERENKYYTIELNEVVHISFIPFTIYTQIDYRTIDKNKIRCINSETEKQLIQFFKAENLMLLNIQNNK